MAQGFKFYYQVEARDELLKRYNNEKISRLLLGWVPGKVEVPRETSCSIQSESGCMDIVHGGKVCIIEEIWMVTVGLPPECLPKQYFRFISHLKMGK